MVQDAARRGYGRHAATYRDARPSYHPAVIDEVVANIGDGAAVELGAGTGIFTRELTQRGIDVIAVEPVEAMRAELVDHAGAADVRDGTAEAIPVDSESADVVVVAQAFHWFDAASALDEIVRVLRPNGRLVTVWNVRDQSVDWVADYSRIIEVYAGDTPRHHTMQWRHAIEGDRRFALTSETMVANPRPTDADGVVARALSTSFIAALPQSQQDRVAAALREAVADLGDTFDYPYRSELQIWTFSGSAHPDR